MKDDLIRRQEAIDALYKCTDIFINNLPVMVDKADAYKALAELPSAQPEIIRCNACKHWNQTSGETKGFGLGECDFHDAKFVICNGYCYWAERREDEQNT